MRVRLRVFCTFACVFAASTLHADFALDGFFQGWLRLGPLTHGENSCNWPADVQALDYIVGEDADSGDEVSELNVLPVEFDEILIDFERAASVEVLDTLGGQNPGALDGIATWVSYDSPQNTIIDSVFYGEDTHHHVTYNVMYLTNLSDQPLFLVGGIGSDDALTIIMDNTYFGVIDACRPPGGDSAVQNRFAFVLPPGEHRILIKLFDWEGDSAFRFRLEQPDGTPVLEGGDVSVSLEPTEMETVPPAPTATIVRSFPDAVRAGQPFDVSLTVTGGPLTIYEQVPVAATIEDSGAGTQNGQQIVWANIQDATVTYTVQVDEATTAFTGAGEEAGGVWLATGGASRVTPEDVIEGGWSTADIADSGLGGAAFVQQVEDAPPTFDMQITGSGSDIWNNADDFRFVWKVAQADNQVVIQGRVDQFDRVTNDWGKAGLMVRRDTSQGSPHVFTMVRPGPTGSPTHGSALQWRGAPNAGSQWGGVLVEVELPHWIRAVYFNGTVFGFFAPDPDTGAPPEESAWVPANPPSHTIDLGGNDTFLIGVAVTSHDDGAQATAMFSGVTLAENEPIGAIRETTDADCAGDAGVTLTLSLPGGGGGTDVTIVETLPDGVSGVDPGPGEFVDGEFRFSAVSNDGDTITYTVTGVTQGATITGEINGFPIFGSGTFQDACPFGCFPPAPGFFVGGGVPSAVSVGPISLDAATNGDCFDGGQLSLLDYLVDANGDNGELEVEPIAGSELTPDFGGNAGGLGISPTPNPDRNPRAAEGILTAWLSQADNRGYINYNDAENFDNPVDNYVVYSFYYLNNTTGDALPGELEIGTDDGYKAFFNQEVLTDNAVCRGIPGYGNGDRLPVIFEPGMNVLVIAVVERGGGTGVRVVLRDEFGDPLISLDPDDPPPVEVCRSSSDNPREICDNGEDDDDDGDIDCDDDDCAADLSCKGVVFRRGDTDTNGRMELTDAIGVFNFLFITGIPPTCFDSADADDNNAIELTDGIRILNVLFLGFGVIPPPGFLNCGLDTTDDAFPACEYSADC